MKRLFALILTVPLLLTACQPADPPGSRGPSKPTATEPPVLVISAPSGNSIEARIGTYSWTYESPTGPQGVCADSTHPLLWQEFLIPLSTAADAAVLRFAAEPQEFTVQCWPDADWGDPEAPAQAVSLTGNTLLLRPGGHIYEVTATWTGENLNASGTVHYAFYVIRNAEP